MKQLIIIISIIFTFNLKAQTTIGWDAGCSYDMNTDPNSLQQAIDDGMTDIRLTNENDFVTNIEITDNTSIKGSYDNCSDAASGSHGINNTVIDGSAITFPVIQMKFIDNADILFDHLTIKNGGGNNGNGSIYQWAGGIGIRDVRGDLVINHSILETNNAFWGGGISINNTSFRGPAPLTVTMSNTLIRQNTITGQGGGIYCDQSTNIGDDVTIILNQGSGIKNNHADGNGGGIYNQKCQIEFNAGASTQPGDFQNIELYHNTSNRSGAGVYTAGGTIDFIGNQTMPFDIYSNQSAFDGTNNGEGGGIFASGTETIVNLTNTNISTNTANRHGAGLFSGFNATINLNSTNNCSYSQYCSNINHNLLLTNASIGGSAMAALFNGNINIFNSIITRNNSDSGSYIALVGSGGKILLEGNIIEDNGINNIYNNESAFFTSNPMTELTLAYNTVINNKFGTFFFNISFDSTLNLFGNIIKDFSTFVLSTQSTSITNISCNIFNDISTITVSMTDTIVGIINFVDGGNRNYRLAGSNINAIDACSSDIYLPNVDLDGNTRGTDHDIVPNLNGPYDLGAYELIVIEEIFMNSFE